MNRSQKIQQKSKIHQSYYQKSKIHQNSITLKNPIETTIKKIKTPWKTTMIHRTILVGGFIPSEKY